MHVKQLIEELRKRDPESVVQTWDAFCDSGTDDVFVSDMSDGKTMICNVNFGQSDATENADGGGVHAVAD